MLHVWCACCAASKTATNLRAESKDGKVQDLNVFDGQYSHREDFLSPVGQECCQYYGEATYYLLTLETLLRRPQDVEIREEAIRALGKVATPGTR